ncbi:MAG: transposase [Cyclobacteriaceae bacterium]|nr:transposase [Cyclobacteriaceae bacterium]
MIQELKVDYRFSIKSACYVLNYTRQAYYKPLAEKYLVDQNIVRQIEKEVQRSRKGCPKRGCRTMYEEFAHQFPFGRDKSIDLLMELGFRVRHPKYYGRATQSGTREFANLLTEKNISNINQVWQADMAHYLHGKEKLYTIYITDVYSQEVVGYGAYNSNEASNYAEVMQESIDRFLSYGYCLKGLIHHSDGGKQYESLVYKTLCEQHEIKQSMCMYSYENPYAEKTNDLINNRYLNVWKPTTLADLRKLQHKAVMDHNKKSKKKKLHRLSPVEFRNQLMSENPFKRILELKPRKPEQPKKRDFVKKKRVA